MADTEPNLSVCFADSSPTRGASGEEIKCSEMPKPPLDRGGGTAEAVTERFRHRSNVTKEMIFIIPF